MDNCAQLPALSVPTMRGLHEPDMVTV